MPAAFLAAAFLVGFSSPVEASSASSRTAVKKASSSRAKAPKKARRVIRQDASGAVVVDRVAVEIAQFYGPYLPVEPFDYPRPLCEEIDVVLEARVHEADEETPEPADAAETVAPSPEPSRLTRVARTFGALLRPKSSESTLRPEDVDLSDLLSAGVQIPVEGVDASRLRDSFLASRGRHRKHLAIDIGAPRGTPVLAAADGEIAQMRREKRGGISLYQKDATGKYLLFYCHFSKYVKGMRPGDKVARGQVIGYVGSTGRVIGGPHLHFSITRLPEDDDNLKAGVAINPYLLFLAAVGS